MRKLIIILIMNLVKKPKLEKIIADHLFKMRVEKGVSQDALSVQLGKGQSDIAKMENGSKRITVLELLSWMAVLDIPCSRLNEILNPIYDLLTDKSKP